MRNFDLTPLYRASVGFDRLADVMDRAMTADVASTTYPPYNIEKTGEDAYRITLAIAGFKAEDIDITAQQNLLTIVGKKSEEKPEGELLHVGIANRSFERRFELADFVLVEDARLNDGLLVIDLVREVPEAMKPKSIAIKTGAPLAAVDTVAVDQAA